MKDRPDVVIACHRKLRDDGKNAKPDDPIEFTHAVEDDEGTLRCAYCGDPVKGRAW